VAIIIVCCWYNLGYYYKGIKLYYYCAFKGLTYTFIISGCFVCMFFKNLKLSGYLHRNQFHKTKCEYVDKILFNLVAGCVMDIALCVFLLFRLF